jgi:hypothetical protein
LTRKLVLPVANVATSSIAVKRCPIFRMPNRRWTVGLLSTCARKDR